MTLKLHLVKRLLLITVLIQSGFSIGQSTCNQIYVTTTGSGAGTESDPTSLSIAMNQAEAGDIIKMAIGTYNLSSPLILLDSVTIEGGFDPGNAWTKTSQAGATTINRTSANPEGATNAQRLVAMYGNGNTGFRLQDLTITTSNANLPGMSTYGIHLNACANYNIVRCQVLPGNAAAGQNGTAGSNGVTGNSGAGGQAGAIDNDTGGGGGGAGGIGGGGTSGGSGGACCAISAYIGAAGGAPSGINGGGGAGGGSGAGENNSGASGGNGGGALGAGGSGGSANGCSGGNCGSNGQAGAVGTNGTTGSTGPAGSHVGGFWIPGGTAGTGSNGTGGAGGGGGGGGGGQGGTFCIDGHGSGGGGGGGGGQAGTGGTGGKGGGASFAVYLYQNGVNGNIIQCNIAPGNAGAGGAGGAGGIGGNGGNGGAGSSYSGGEVGCGGNGGAGGKGGNGGNGGNGQNGVSTNIFTEASGQALSTEEGNVNLAGQMVITAQNTTCPYTDMEFNAGTTAVWDFGSNATTQLSSGMTVTTQFMSSGRQTILYGVDTYVGFVNIPSDTPTPAAAGNDQYVCDNNTGTLAGNVPAVGTGSWSSLGTATVDYPSDANSAVSGLAMGDNLFVWTIDGCCGSSSDTVNLKVGQSSAGTDVVTACNTYTWIDGATYTNSNSTATYTLTNASGCDSVVTLNLTINNVDNTVTQLSGISFEANATGAVYQWVDCNNNFSDVSGENGQTFTAAANGSYAVMVTENGCTDTSGCYLVTTVGLHGIDIVNNVNLYPNPTSGDVHLKFDGTSSLGIEVIDASGRILNHMDNVLSGEKIQMSHLDPGMYFIRLISKDVKQEIKVIKQ